jgi:hypothetical protein
MPVLDKIKDNVRKLKDEYQKQPEIKLVLDHPIPIPIRNAVPFRFDGLIIEKADRPRKVFRHCSSFVIVIPKGWEKFLPETLECCLYKRGAKMGVLFEEQEVKQDGKT